jgi:hypothetical protein
VYEGEDHHQADCDEDRPDEDPDRHRAKIDRDVAGPFSPEICYPLTLPPELAESTLNASGSATE